MPHVATVVVGTGLQACPDRGRAIRRAALWPLLVLLALLVAAFIACGGGDEEGGAVDQKAFDATFRELDTMIQRARSGDVAGAQRSFEALHGFTHRLDSEMRARGASETLRKETFDAVSAIEDNLGGRRDAATLADQGERLRGLLRQAATALGYRPPP